MKVLYFAWLRSHTGVGEESLEPPAEVATVEALLDWLEARSPGHGAALADRSKIRVAVNQQFASPEDRVNSGDEVALFPPVTGG